MASFRSSILRFLRAWKSSLVIALAKAVSLGLQRSGRGNLED